MTSSLEDDAGASESPLLLDAQRARRFLRELRDRPFIAIVVDDGKVRVYSKDIDADEALRRIRDVVLADDPEETHAHEA